MFKRNSYNLSAPAVVFVVLMGVVGLAEVAAAGINEQVAQLDFDTAGLDDVIRIFGEPVKYHWGGETYTKDNLPSVYIGQYPDEFGVVMANGRVNELRFESAAAGYVWTGGIVVGSLLEEVLAVTGQPRETVVGQPCGYTDGVLYKDINGKTGYCYYGRADLKVRFFFLAYKVSALYLTGNTGPSGPVVVNEFDDVRSEDLGGCDFSDRPGLIETLTFNLETVWPEPANMPPGCSPAEVLNNAMNPGLRIYALHAQAITGAGVNVGIIDQPIYPDHAEYAGKIAAYFDTGCDGPPSSMHGPAVASLLVGTNCGTAPDARVYYAAVPSWKKDAGYYADALHWIIVQNEGLSESEKIHVVSVSAAPSGEGSPFLYNQNRWDRACERAEAAGIAVLDCTSHRGLIGRCWYDASDAENVAKCTPGAPGQSPWFDPADILAPASVRTTAQHYDYHGLDSYIYWGRGGLSWSIPYCAGVLALGRQIRPDLAAEQMLDMLFESAYVTGEGARIINPQEFVRRLSPAGPLEAALTAIEQAIAEKLRALEAISAALEGEQAAYERLEELLESGDYGELRKGDIIKARQRTHSAIQHLVQSAGMLIRSIRKLQHAQVSLGEAPEAIVLPEYLLEYLKLHRRW